MRIRWTAGLRFLHPLLSELRGHGKGSRAGNGKPGASEVVAGLENPPCMRRRRDAERNGSSEAAALPVEKAAIVAVRTVNRHRWMRRSLRAGGRSVVKELGKMTP